MNEPLKFENRRMAAILLYRHLLNVDDWRLDDILAYDVHCFEDGSVVDGFKVKMFRIIDDDYRRFVNDFADWLDDINDRV